MLKKIAITTIAASSLMAAASASAITGIYVDGALGYASQSATSEPFAGVGVTLDKREKTHFAWDAAFGYMYDINTDFGLGLELGYGSYGQVKWKNDDSSAKMTTDETAWTLLGVFNWSINDMFDAYVKAGAAYGKNHVKTDGLAGGSTDDNRHKVRPMTVLGVDYKIMPELAVNLEWQHIFGQDITSTGDTDKFQTVNALMLGLKYTFAM